MVEFNVMETFGVDDANDCESIEKALEEITEAGKYGIDYAERLGEARKILEQRKIELGCD